MHRHGPQAAWLDRYADPLPIRSRGAFHLVSARRRDGGGCVVVVPGPSTDPKQAEEAFAEVERVHALIDHVLVPRVAARGSANGTPFLELDCDAVADGIEVLRLLADAERKVAYGQADALVTSLREALQAAHAVTDPTSGAPVCIGRLSHANILFSATGRWFLVGFGRSFPTDKATSVPDGSTVLFQAPEVATGAPPTPTADYVALLLLMRSLLPYVDLNEAITRLVRGELREQDAELSRLIRFFDQRLVYESPPLRASIEEGVAASQRIRELLSVRLDPEGLAATLATLLEENLPLGGEPRSLAPPSNEASTLVVGRDAAWFMTPDGARRRLGRPHRRILVALLERHRARGGDALAMWDLLEAGWPGERPGFEAGSNRVYVALTRLRAMGLRDVIERFEGGYRVAPTTVVRVAEEELPG